MAFIFGVAFTKVVHLMRLLHVMGMFPMVVTPKH